MTRQLYLTGSCGFLSRSGILPFCLGSSVHPLPGCSLQKAGNPAVCFALSAFSDVIAGGGGGSHFFHRMVGVRGP